MCVTATVCFAPPKFAAPPKPHKESEAKDEQSLTLKDYWALLAAGGPQLEKLQRRTRAAAVSRAAGGPAFAPQLPPEPVALLGPEVGAIIPYDPPQPPEADDPAGLLTSTAQNLAVLRKSQRLLRKHEAARTASIRAEAASWSQQKQTDMPRPGLADPCAVIAPLPVGSIGDIHIDRIVCVPSVEATAQTFHDLAKKRLDRSHGAPEPKLHDVVEETPQIIRLLPFGSRPKVGNICWHKFVWKAHCWHKCWGRSPLIFVTNGFSHNLLQQ